MSEDVKIKLGIDVSDAEKAAQTLPDAFARIQGKENKDFARPSGGVIDLNRLNADAVLITEIHETTGEQKLTAEQKQAEKIRKQEQKESDEMLRRKYAEYAKKKKLEEQTAKDADEWIEEFTDKLTGGLITTLAPLALFGKGISMFTDWIEKGSLRQSQVNAAVSVGGFSPKEVKMARMLAYNLGSSMTEDEGQQFMEEVMTKARNYARGISDEGALGLEAFGMGKAQREEVLSGQASYIEMLGRMADEYERTGNTAQYAMKMQSLFGDKWEKLRPQLAAGSRVLGIDIAGKSSTSLGDIFDDQFGINTQRFLHGQGSVKNWMGGSKGGGLQSFAMASSLQSMGGGDVLSAVNRGPMEKVAESTERTAVNTERMSSSMDEYFNKTFNTGQPATLGK